MTPSRLALAAIALSAASIASAAVTTLDGSPTVFEAITVGDFNDGTSQGWVEGGPMHIGGLFFDGTQLQNNTATTGGDPFIQLELPNSTLPGVPANVTLGSLPGQYDVVQFDLRFDSLPTTAIDSTVTRGDQFFLVGGPNGIATFYVNDGTGMRNNDTAVELQTDGAYHTYTILRQPGDPGWGRTYSRIRIDPINNGTSVGTLFSLDNVRIGRSNDVEPFAAFAVPNLVENGSFDDVSNYQMNTSGAASPNANVGGSFGDFPPFQGSNADIDNWTHFSRDGIALEAAVGTPGLVDGNGELDGTYYLDALWTFEQTEYLSNSAENYDHGLTQSVSITPGQVDPDATYTLSLDFGVNLGTGTGPGGGHENASVTLALTDGVGSDATDLSNAIASVTSDPLDTDPNQLTLEVTGAEILGASDLNVVFSHVNSTPIPGFPGSVAGVDIAPQPPILVSQVAFRGVALSPADMAGDVNNDGLVDATDLSIAEAYLAGDGGQAAVDRQNTLIGLGNAAADVLAALNLSDFDLTGDEFFDADDVAAIADLVNALPGDYNDDGVVDAADYTVWRDGGSPDPSQAGYDLWRDNFGASSQTSAIPEPGTLAMAAAVAALAAASRRSL